MAKKKSEVSPDFVNLDATTNTHQTDDFDALISKMQKRYESSVTSKTTLFKVATTIALYDIFLQSISEDRRQYYTCRSCENFINRFGGLVRIDGDRHISVVWDPKDAECCPELKVAINCLLLTVSLAPIEEIFISSEKQLGIEKNSTKDGKIWTHFYLKNKRIHKDKLKTENQVVAEKKQDFDLLLDAIYLYSLEDVKTAFTLLSKNVLARSEKFLGQIKWFYELKESLEQKVTGSVPNVTMLWLAVAEAPTGFCHIKSSVLGTLLEDIQNNLPLDDIKAKFASKVDSTVYMRPQAPAEVNIIQAEKIVEKLGIKESLKRKFATLDDIQTIWKPKQAKKKKIPNDSGVFSHLTPKEKTKENVTGNQILDSLSSTATNITWEKFRKTVLPTAIKIEFYVPNVDDNYGSLVTAENSSSPPILQWDSDEKRNPVSTYLYAEGSSPEEWNLKAKTFVEVTAISMNPWMWFEQDEKFTHQGIGVIFILNDCKDLNYSGGGGFFPECLKSELHSVRATIEAYARSAEISGKETANTCGIRIEKEAANKTSLNYLFKVEDDNGLVMLYKMDRWD